MSDENGEDPESGAGVGRTDPATCPGTQNAVGHDLPTTPQVGSASDGGEFSSSNPSDSEGGECNTRAEGSPTRRLQEKILQGRPIIRLWCLWQRYLRVLFEMTIWENHRDRLIYSLSLVLCLTQWIYWRMDDWHGALLNFDSIVTRLWPPLATTHPEISRVNCFEIDCND